MKIRHRLMQAVRTLGGSRFTTFQLIGFPVGVLWFYWQAPAANLVLISVFALAAINLVCAMATNRVFTRQPALFALHLALVMLIVLAGAGQLTRLEGRFELSEGELFRGRMLESKSGPLHRNSLDQLRFTNRGFRVEYDEGLRRNHTVNRVTWFDAENRAHQAVIGDQYPLVLDGYRFYTSHNKGYSLAFVWRPHNDEPVLGTVNLPSYPARQFEQARSWVLPGTSIEAWAKLELSDGPIDIDKPFTLGETPGHHVILRIAGKRAGLRAGERFVLPEGTLTYDGLRQWMGYKVYYDWTRPWMVASTIIAILSMLAHLLIKFRKIEKNGVRVIFS